MECSNARNSGHESAEAAARPHGQKGGRIYVTRLDRGGFKVGFTRNLHGRAISISSQFCTAHTIVATFPAKPSDETALHHELAPSRLPWNAYRSREIYADTAAFRVWLEEIPQEYRINVRHPHTPRRGSHLR